MTNNIETLVYSFQEYQKKIDNGEILPKYYFRNALDEYVFIKTRSRYIAQKWIDDNYGIGKYSVRTTRQDGASREEASCIATETRRGQAKYRNANFGLPGGI